LEPFIEDCSRFKDSLDRDVLEIDVGLSAGHQRFAQAGARLTEIDLTNRTVEYTRSCLVGLMLWLR